MYMDGCFDMMHYGHANALRQVGKFPRLTLLLCGAGFCSLVATAVAASHPPGTAASGLPEHAGSLNIVQLDCNHTFDVACRAFGPAPHRQHM